VEGYPLFVDATGVLDSYYPLPDMAFMEGSLVLVGGHNLLEPAMHGVPVLSGPHTHNFREITISITEGNACQVVRTTDDLVSSLKVFPKMKISAGREVRLGRLFQGVP